MYPIKIKIKQVKEELLLGVKVKQKKRYMVSFSGGKDSTAMLFMLLERGYPITDVVFADTKYEFPEMYIHIENVRKILERDYSNIRFTILRTEKKLEDLIYGKYTRGYNKGEIRGLPKVVAHCGWSRDSKYIPLNKFMDGHIRYIAIAADEPKRYKPNNIKKGYRYPLYEWGITEDQCLQYLKAHKLLSPIHLMFKRTGCWWCPKQSKESLVFLCSHYPERWKQLKQWEADSPKGFKINYTLEDIEKKILHDSIKLSWFE